MSTEPVKKSAERSRMPLTKTRSSRLSKQNAEVIEDDDHHQQQPQTKTPIRIPETRVESFEDRTIERKNEELERTGIAADDNEDSRHSGKTDKVLVRSHAMCGDDDTKLNTRAIEKQSSSKTGSSMCSSLSWESSNEVYTDDTGINLQGFIVGTLHKNKKDREMLLQIEEELRKFVLDNSKSVFRFPPMSSYNRMLVHRVAAHFGLDHNVDQTGQAIAVTKNASTRMPDGEFRQFIQNNLFTDDVKRSLRRDPQSSYEEVLRSNVEGVPVHLGSSANLLGHTAAHHQHLLDYRKTRSFEERDGTERSKRFYQQESSSSQEILDNEPTMQPAVNASGVLTLNPNSVAHPGSMMTRPWSSTDSHNSSLDVPPNANYAHLVSGTAAKHVVPASMQKAGSFGGVPTVYRQAALPTDHSPVRPNGRANNLRSQSGASVGSDLSMSPHSMPRQPSIPESYPYVAIYGTSHVICAVPPNEVPAHAIILHPRTMPVPGTSMPAGQPQAAAGYVPMNAAAAPYIPQMHPQTYQHVAHQQQQAQQTDPSALPAQMQNLNLQTQASQSSAASSVAGDCPTPPMQTYNPAQPPQQYYYVMQPPTQAAPNVDGMVPVQYVQYGMPMGASSGMQYSMPYQGCVYTQASDGAAAAQVTYMAPCTPNYTMCASGVDGRPVVQGVPCMAPIPSLQPLSVDCHVANDNHSAQHPEGLMSEADPTTPSMGNQ